MTASRIYSSPGGNCGAIFRRTAPAAYPGACCPSHKRARSCSIAAGPCEETAMPDYPLPSADPASLGFAATPLQHLDRLVRQHIEEDRYPGAQIALARHGKLALFRTYGNAKTEPAREPATGDT